MNLSNFYTATEQGGFYFNREQGSHFAKDVAGDFNPLHDADAKKFCIPGDLIFSLALAKLGVSKKMKFRFSGMVNENIKLNFEEQPDQLIKVIDDGEKEYLSIERSGEMSTDSEFARNLANSYVAFSGHTFPHVLVPLMASEKVMINPVRPMVIYQSMSIDLLQLDFTNPELEITDTRLDVQGKRGTAILQFCFKEKGKVVGHGEKVIVLSGLREFDQSILDTLIFDYEVRKNAYV
jgi:hypothetical protein